MLFDHLPTFAYLLMPILTLLALIVAHAFFRQSKTLSSTPMLLATALVASTSSAAAAALDAVVQSRLDTELRCQLGVYSLPGQRSVTITGANGQPRGLQYTLSNGQFGELKEVAKGSWASESLVIQFEPCSAGTLRLTRAQVVENGQRVRLVERVTSFTSDGAKLHGKLVLPPSAHARAMAVWIEGSNNNPSTDDTVWQYELARRGVAVFVYDKRGTGTSNGAPTSDFHARARDTAAAVTEARRLAPRIARVGVIGGSQGGWVAPLTATLVPLDFVVAAFAMAEGPIAQDQALVAQQLREAGFDERIRVDAKELTAITEKIVRSNSGDGLAELDAFKARFAGAPWLDALQPRSYTGLFLKFSSEDIRTHGPALAQGLSFDYEPRPVIESIKPRQLWLLGGSDRQAPNAGTQAILRQIQQKRPTIEVVVFPKADHGLIESTRTANGVAMAYSAKLFDLTADWISHKKLSVPKRFVMMPSGD
jgi:uncharacterized protein